MSLKRKLKRAQERKNYETFSKSWRKEQTLRKMIRDVKLSNDLDVTLPESIAAHDDSSLGRKPTRSMFEAKNKEIRANIAKTIAQQELKRELESKLNVQTEEIPDLDWEEPK